MKDFLIKDFKSSVFRLVTGASPSTFHSMVAEVKYAYAEVHKKRRHHRKRSGLFSLPGKKKLVKLLCRYAIKKILQK